MKTYLARLDRRSSRVLYFSAAVGVILIGYAFVWAPLARNIMRLETEVPDQRNTLNWMQAAAGIIDQSKTSDSAAQPVFTIVSSTAERSGMSSHVKQLQPDGDTRIRVWMEAAEFNALVQWLHILESRHAVFVAELSLVSNVQPGRVDARMALVTGR